MNLETILKRHILRDEELTATVSEILRIYRTYEDAAVYLEITLTDHLIESGVSNFVAELLALVIMHVEWNTLIDMLDETSL